MNSIPVSQFKTILGHLEPVAKASTDPLVQMDSQTISMADRELLVTVPFTTEFDRKILVDFKTLFKLLKKIKTEEFTFEIGENELILHYGKSSAGLPYYKMERSDEEEMFIESVKESCKNTKEIDDGFWDAVKFCLPSVTKADESIVLSCVHFDRNVIETCDNIRASRVNYTHGLNPFLIPAQYMKDMLKYHKECLFDTVGQTDGVITFINEDGLIFSCRVFSDEHYLDIDPFIQIKNGHKAQLPCGIKDSLETAEIMMDEDNTVEVRLNSDECVIKSKSDKGWVREILDIEYDDEELNFVTSPYFIENMDKFDNKCTITDKTILFETEDSVFVSIKMI